MFDIILIIFIVITGILIRQFWLKIIVADHREKKGLYLEKGILNQTWKND